MTEKEHDVWNTKRELLKENAKDDSNSKQEEDKTTSSNNKYFGDDEDAQMAAYMIELTDKFGDEILDAWPNMTKEARRMKIDCL